MFRNDFQVLSNESRCPNFKITADCYNFLCSLKEAIKTPAQRTLLPHLRNKYVSKCFPGIIYRMKAVLFSKTTAVFNKSPQVSTSPRIFPQLRNLLAFASISLCDLEYVKKTTTFCSREKTIKAQP